MNMICKRNAILLEISQHATEVCKFIAYDMDSYKILNETMRQSRI